MTMMVMFQINDKLKVDMPSYTISLSPTLREFCNKIDEQISSSDPDIGPDEAFDPLEVESGVI